MARSRARHDHSIAAKELSDLGYLLRPRIFLLPLKIGYLAEARRLQSQSLEDIDRVDSRATDEVNRELVEIVTDLAWDDRLPATYMEIHFGNCAIGSGRGVENLKTAVIPTAAYRAALDGVTPLARNSPSRSREGRGGQRLNRI
jgi:hypothetical protein